MRVPLVLLLLVAVVMTGLVGAGIGRGAPADDSGSGGSPDDRGVAPPPPAVGVDPDRPMAVTEGVFVAPGGSDANAGTLSAPLATVQRALSLAGREGRPRTVYLRGGVYRQTVSNPSMLAGSASNRLRLTSYPGERATFQGQFHVASAHYWTIDNLAFTWDDALPSTRHMVRFTNGIGWIFERNELYGAKSFAALHITPWNTRSEPHQWTVRHNIIRDTKPSNGTNQDHNMYVGTLDGTGLIERNLIYGAPNGENIKLGGGSSTDSTNNITIRYNTLVDASSNLLIAGPSQNNRIERNLLAGSGASRTPGAPVMLWDASASGNLLRNNFYGDSSTLIGRGGTTPASLVTAFDGGGNVLGDPRFADPTRGDFRPTNPKAASYGHRAQPDFTP